MIGCSSNSSSSKALAGRETLASWDTIPQKRARYRQAFDRFDPRKVAAYDARKVRSLLADAGIVRNKLKIRSAIANARADLKIQEEFGSFDAYLWRKLRQRQAAAESQNVIQGRPRPHRRVGRDEQGPEKARV